MKIVAIKEFCKDVSVILSLSSYYCTYRVRNTLIQKKNAILEKLIEQHCWIRSSDHVTHITSLGRFQSLELFYKNPFRIFRLKENSTLEKQQRLTHRRMDENTFLILHSEVCSCNKYFKNFWF